MSIIVDTSVWSLALHWRTSPTFSPAVTRLQDLITNDHIALLDADKKSFLEFVSSEQFTRLRDYLKAFPNLELAPEDYKLAVRVLQHLP